MLTVAFMIAALSRTHPRMRLSRRLRVLCSLVVMLVAGQGPAHAADTVSFCSDHWPPYSALSDGEIRGISVDVAREAARRAGLTAKFQELPWNRCLEMVRQGLMDAVLDAAPREEFVTVSTSVSSYTNTLWVRAGSGLTRMDFSELAGLRMGLVDGYWYPEDLMAKITGAGMIIDRSVDEATAIRKLAFGRVDAIVADRIVTRHFANRHNLALRALVPDHSSDMLYMSFNSEKAGLRDRIDTALAGMKRDGTIRDVFVRHLGPGVQAAQ